MKPEDCPVIKKAVSRIKKSLEKKEAERVSGRKWRIGIGVKNTPLPVVRGTEEPPMKFFRLSEMSDAFELCELLNRIDP